MQTLWFMVYWGTIITGTVLMQFYKMYWQCGRFTVKSKVKFVLKQLIFQVFGVLVALGVLGALLIYYFKVEYSDYEAMYAASLIMSNVYGMGVLVVLLAHGLIKMPIYLWKC